MKNIIQNCPSWVKIAATGFIILLIGILMEISVPQAAKYITILGAAIIMIACISFMKYLIRGVGKSKFN